MSFTKAIVIIVAIVILQVVRWYLIKATIQRRVNAQISAKISATGMPNSINVLPALSGIEGKNPIKSTASNAPSTISVTRTASHLPSFIKGIVSNEK